MKKTVFVGFCLLTSFVSSAGQLCERPQSIVQLDTLRYTTCLMLSAKPEVFSGVQLEIENISDEEIIFFQRENGNKRLDIVLFQEGQIYASSPTHLCSDCETPQPTYLRRVLKPGSKIVDHFMFSEIWNELKSSDNFKESGLSTIEFMLPPEFLRKGENGNGLEAGTLRFNEWRKLNPGLWLPGMRHYEHIKVSKD
jgi:hypothetical protein